MERNLAVVRAIRSRLPPGEVPRTIVIVLPSKYGAAWSVLGVPTDPMAITKPVKTEMQCFKSIFPILLKLI